MADSLTADTRGVTPRQALSLSTRHLGNVTVVQCSGRLVVGPEADALKKCIDSLLQDCRSVVLDLGQVTFVDSSGLGMLIRTLVTAGAVGVKLRLCTLPAYLQDLLRLTSLAPVFETYASVKDAVVAAYERENPPELSARTAPLVLCVDRSGDVLAYLGEVLRKAGYDVLTNTNVYDSLILMHVTHPAVVVLGPGLSAAPGTVRRFRNASAARRVVELGKDFSSHDAGIAASTLLDKISSILR